VDRDKGSREWFKHGAGHFQVISQKEKAIKEGRDGF